MKPLIWKLWLTDRVIEGNSLADWEAVPSNNFIASLEYFGENSVGNRLYRISMGSDWYWMLNDEIFQTGESHDIPGQFIPNPAPEGSSVKSGIWVSQEVMDNVFNEIHDIITEKTLWPDDIF